MVFMMKSNGVMLHPYVVAMSIAFHPVCQFTIFTEIMFPSYVMYICYYLLGIIIISNVFPSRQSAKGFFLKLQML
jgi:hypothetical protein